LRSYRHLQKYPMVVVAAYGIDDIFRPWKTNVLQHFVDDVADQYFDFARFLPGTANETTRHRMFSHCNKANKTLKN